MMRICAVFLTGLLVLAITSCATGSDSAGPAQIASLSQPFSSEHYAVAANDVLQVDVYRELDLSGKYQVDPSGTVNLPLIGRVPVSGRNPQSIEYLLKQKFAAGYIVDPDVRVSVIQFRPVFLSGEVEKPGRYPFTPGMTVQQAVVLAGGPTRFAAKKFYLQRMFQHGDNRIRVDGNSILFPGDIVTVGERLF